LIKKIIKKKKHWAQQQQTPGYTTSSIIIILSIEFRIIIFPRSNEMSNLLLSDFHSAFCPFNLMPTINQIAD
jgi:hypothetical protein